MSIQKHSLANSANKVGKLSIHSPLLHNTLAQIADPPKQLFYRGDISLLQGSVRSGPVKVAIVGSRKVTPYGRSVTHRLASELARQGIVVVSGLALGVDGIAHQGALDSRGPTIAVLPSDVERIYPSSHRHLAKQIVAQGGLLISEYQDSPTPMKHQFIARNRLISGISDAVLITEAAHKSGSLHTAGFGLEQGKQVFAVPGNIDNPNSAGTNNLIKVGAAPVTDVNDLLQALGLNKQLPLHKEGDNPEEVVILQLLAKGHNQTDQLLSLSKLTPQVFNQALTMLEINGVIRTLGAGQWTLI